MAASAGDPAVPGVAPAVVPAAIVGSKAPITIDGAPAQPPLKAAAVNHPKAHDTGKPLPAAARSGACDPPFEIDAAGHRHMKPQCL